MQVNLRFSFKIQISNSDIKFRFQISNSIQIPDFKFKIQIQDFEFKI